MVPELGGVKLATNTEEELLVGVAPECVANKFLRNRREEEYAAKQPKDAPKAAAEVKVEETVTDDEPITGDVFRAPMGGRIIEVNVKAGDKVKKGQVMMVL